MFFLLFHGCFWNYLRSIPLCCPSERLGEHIMKNVLHMVAECYGFFINCFSGAQAVLLLIIEAGSYLKVRELDAEQTVFQNVVFKC